MLERNQRGSMILTDDDEFDMLDAGFTTEEVVKQVTSSAPTMDAKIAPIGLKNPTTNTLLSDPIPMIVSPTSFGQALDNLIGGVPSVPNTPNQLSIAPMPDGHSIQNPPPRRTINPSELVAPDSPNTRRTRSRRAAGAAI